MAHTFVPPAQSSIGSPPTNEQIEYANLSHAAGIVALFELPNFI